MAPATPPPLDTSTFSPYTPPTPRYAPIDEPDCIHGKRRKLQNHQSIQKYSLVNPDAKSQILAKPTIIPLTPAETPVNRKKIIEAIGTDNHFGAPGRILFPSHTPKVGSGRTYHKPTTPKNDNNNLEAIISLGGRSDHSKEKKFEIFDDRIAVRAEADNENPFDQRALKKTRHERHPYQPLPPDVPGMWYVFRGKKVFRPFPKDDAEKLSSIKPRRLFADQLAKTTSCNSDDPFTDNHKNDNQQVDSEEELTDVEIDREIFTNAAARKDPHFYR